MTTNIKPPDFVTFRATAVIEAAGDQELPRFSMVAYSGGEMRIAGFPHAVVVDLGGLDVPNQSVPIRLDHKSNQGVGHTTRIEAREGQLIAEGLISRETSWARDVARSGSNGFPWQASIGGPVLEAEFVPPGQTVEVNDQRFEGPLHVVRKMRLKEISFVDSDADQETKVVVAAQSQESSDMPKTMEAGDVADTGDNVAPSESQTPSTPPALEATADTADAIDEFRDGLRQAAVEETRRSAEDAVVEAMRPPANDSDKWFISLVVSRNCGACQRLRSDWLRNASLLALAAPEDPKRSWSHFHVYYRDDASQAWRWKDISIRGYPTVLVQPPSSKEYGDPSTVVYQGTYNGNPAALAADIGRAIRLYVSTLAEQVAKTDDETGANKQIGKTIAAAVDADTTVRVRLNQ